MYRGRRGVQNPSLVLCARKCMVLSHVLVKLFFKKKSPENVILGCFLKVLLKVFSGAFHCQHTGMFGLTWGGLSNEPLVHRSPFQAVHDGGRSPAVSYDAAFVVDVFHPPLMYPIPEPHRRSTRCGSVVLRKHPQTARCSPAHGA